VERRVLGKARCRRCARATVQPLYRYGRFGDFLLVSVVGGGVIPGVPVPVVGAPVAPGVVVDPGSVPGFESVSVVAPETPGEEVGMVPLALSPTLLLVPPVHAAIDSVTSSAAVGAASLK